MNHPSEVKSHLQELVGPKWCWRCLVINRPEIPEWVPLGDAAVADVGVIYREIDNGNGTKTYAFFGWIPFRRAWYGRPTKWRRESWFVKREEIVRDEKSLVAWFQAEEDLSIKRRDESTYYTLKDMFGQRIGVRVGGSGRTAAIYDHDGDQLAVIYRAHTGAFIVNYGVESSKRHPTLQAAIDKSVANIETLRKVAR